jgi:hypothetical protein
VIKALEGNRYQGDTLKPGKCYKCEPVEEGTLSQNSAFHALVQEYWTSGAHSYRAKNFEHFRALIKLNLGAGVERYINLVEADGTPCEGRADWRLKSWADYTKRERTETINRLIAEMLQARVDSRKFEEILAGLEANKTASVTHEEALQQG